MERDTDVDVETAARRNPMFATRCHQLIARGKPVKVALCAIARKLLIHLNTQLKNADLKTWLPKCPHPE